MVRSPKLSSPRRKICSQKLRKLQSLRFSRQSLHAAKFARTSTLRTKELLSHNPPASGKLLEENILRFQGLYRNAAQEPSFHSRTNAVVASGTNGHGVVYGAPSHR